VALGPKIRVIFLPDAPIPVQQPLGELLHGGAAMKDQVVAILDLGKQTMCEMGIFRIR
jgi:hypothetical protein